MTTPKDGGQGSHRAINELGDLDVFDDDQGRYRQQIATYRDARIAELEAENAEANARADRAVDDRFIALSVTSRDGLLSSEWIMRTGRAERRVTELEAELAEANARAKRAEDLLEKAERECARLRDEIGNALASMANCPRCWARRTAGHSENCASKKCSTCISLGYDAWQEMEWCGTQHRFKPSDCSKDCPQHPGWISPSKSHAALEGGK